MLRATAVAAAMLAATLTTSQAQIVVRRPPAPLPVPDTSAAIGTGASYALFDLSSRYLQTLGGLGGPSTQGGLFGTGPNPGGGGAPAPPAAPKYRAWSELYGLGATTGAQASYPGDTRRTYGGVAGFAMTVAPSATLGMSIDQSRSKIDITGLPQHATLDLTQFGVNGSYELGSWTFSAAGVAGFAGVDANRDTPSGAATASYGANLWGLITEADYFIPLGSARIVPKFGADWTQTHAKAYAETGGIDAVMVPASTADRSRIFAGAEIGNTWVISNTVFDLSGYVRGVDILSQNIPSLTVSAVSGPATPVTVFGVSEAKYGIDAGGMASLRLSPIARIYAVYDGRFRNGLQSNSGTLGLEFRW
ncbi:MAG TPA: autotransporter outer membrane beta-barrel domain-containing protein [Xanthobacteraceae bacterium]